MRDFGMVCLFGAFIIALFPDETKELILQVFTYVQT